MTEPTKDLSMEKMQIVSNVPSLNGVYTLSSSENVEEYLKALGVGLVPRKVQAVTRPNCTIHYHTTSKVWTIIIESIFQTKEITFKTEEKFQDETFDGRKCQSEIQVLDNGTIFTWNQICEEGPDVAAIMSSFENGFTWNMKAGEISCEFKYRRGLPLHQMLNNATAQNA